MPAGQWTLQVASTAQPDLKTTAAVDLNAGDVYSLVVLDAPDGGLTLATHADAVSAAVTPSGSIETGGGGTASGGSAGGAPGGCRSVPASPGSRCSARRTCGPAGLGHARGVTPSPTPGEPAAYCSGGTADPAGRASGSSSEDPPAQHRTGDGPRHVEAPELGRTGDDVKPATGVIRAWKPGRHRRPGDRVLRGLTAAGVLLLLVACGAGARAAANDAAGARSAANDAGGDLSPAAAQPTAAAPSQPVATKNPKAGTASGGR